MTGQDQVTGWVAVKATLSPKQHVGWVDLYWGRDRDRPAVTYWGPEEFGVTLTFESIPGAEAALAEAFGPEWRTKGIRIELRHEQMGLPTC